MGTAVLFFLLLLLFIVVVLLAADALARRYATSWRQGKIGEAKTRFLHLRRLDRKVYTSVHGLYLPLSDRSGITEIDHVVVSVHGVFVIETKNISGTIFGQHDEHEWTIGYGAGPQRTYQLRNPLRQNGIHARAVADFLGIEEVAVIPLVFQVGVGRPATEMGPDVIFRRGLVERMESYTAKPLTEADATRFGEALRIYRRETNIAAARRQHSRQLDEKRWRESASRAVRRHRRARNSTDRYLSDGR